MNYHRLRSNIYRNELKQLLSAISQLGTFVAVSCYQFIVPLVLGASMMAVATIAESDTGYSWQIFYQSIYLLLIFAMIKVQAKAILATPYRAYINSLPITKAQHMRSNLLLSALAGNLLLFAPLVLYCFTPTLQGLLDTRYFLLFSVMVLLCSQTALYRKRPPFLSIVVWPLVASTLALDFNSLNTIWLLVVLLELWGLDKYQFAYKPLPMRHYGTMIAVFVSHRLVNVVSRVFMCLVIVAFFKYVVANRPDYDNPIFHWVITLPIALLIGSYQFEVERFRDQYRHYLATLPLSLLYRRGIEALPLLLLALAFGGLYWWGLGFALKTIGVLLALIATTVAGVIYLNKFYFIATGVMMIGLVGFVF